MKKSTRTALFVLYTLFKVAVVLLLAYFAFMMFLFNFGGIDFNLYVCCFVLIATGVLLAVAWFLPRGKVRFGFTVSGIAVGLAGVIACVSCMCYNVHIDLIRIQNEAINVYDYLAFDPDSKIARLEKEASLRFSEEDELPALDGAAAFFPLYSAFIEATYPNSEERPITFGYSGNADGRNRPVYNYNNTIGGYMLLAQGNIDVMFAFGPDEEQLAFAASYETEYELVPIGYEAFVFFTNAKNPVSSLTADEIRSVYAGEATNWRELGGENTKILPYQRNQGSGSQTALRAFMGDKPLMEAPTELVNSFMWGIIEEVSDYKNHPGAMGFSFLNYAESIVGNPNVKILEVGGVAPSLETVQNGSYPVRMPFYAVIRKGERTGNIARLLDWILSDEGQTLVEKSGFARVDR